MDTPTTPPVEIVFWSRAGATRDAGSLAQAQAETLAFEPEGRFYAARLQVPAAGTLVLELSSPRPLRLWLDGAPVLDEGLFWRCYERHLRAAVVAPCLAGPVAMLVEVGPRSSWPASIDRDCPSRRRAHVRAALQQRLPDRLGMTACLVPGVQAPATSLRFLPTQFRRDDITWQHVLAQPFAGLAADPPSLDHASPLDRPEPVLLLTSSVLPGAAREGTTAEERQRGWRRFFVPVGHFADDPEPLRRPGDPETRVEPSVEPARLLSLRVEGPGGAVEVPMPGYESLGRQAPVRQFRSLPRPQFEATWAQLPEPVLPPRLAWTQRLYHYTWDMLHRLVREPRPESGLPGLYVATALKNFAWHQFVWDSSFTAMCTAYAWRAFPVHASLDLLLSRQFDGGYIHREHDIRDGLPAAYEPDFSPNPPILSVAEWAIACLTGDRLRLARVYPPLTDLHRWLRANRQLPDGTYWTTGLANGLDNSPSLGEGYPCLTAQMAHDAEVLGRMARALGRPAEAEAWEAERAAIAQALNAHLWSPAQSIYATSLAEGGHNPNKVVTAFWPLWAGVVPADRVEALARHLQDPHSFWRHHPIPSLAADSPHFRPAGDYWLGSTWAPTNFAAIKGFARAGRWDLARLTAERHLYCMYEVLRDTGSIWENYSSEKSERGSWSGPDYCWSSLGPVALLLEVVLGLEPDALHNTLRWNLPEETVVGVRRLPLGPATVSVEARRRAEGGYDVEVNSDRALRLEIQRQGEWRAYDCPCGVTRVALEA